jgi:retron-type reverse transcriptase
MAITNITQKAKSMSHAIEGDIKGAFDNVDFEIMIKILKKRIDDKRFLKLILNSLKCGIIYNNYRFKSTIGTTQGSVLSPLLYNIYFHEFDYYIHTTIKDQFEQKNIIENRSDRPAHKLYNYISKTKSKLKLNQTIIDLKQIFILFF